MELKAGKQKSSITTRPGLNWMEDIREWNVKNVILKINRILFHSFNIKTPKCYV
jgi:hypothetical protein